MAKQAGVKRGFGLVRCPLCGAKEVIWMRLDEAILKCPSCEVAFTIETLRERNTEYTRLVEWLDRAIAMMPEIEE